MNADNFGQVLGSWNGSYSILRNTGRAQIRDFDGREGAEAG